MTATIKSPFRELMALQDRMNRMFDSGVHGEGTDEEMEAAAWKPAVDIYNTLLRQATVAVVGDFTEGDLFFKRGTYDITLSYRQNTFKSLEMQKLATLFMSEAPSQAIIEYFSKSIVGKYLLSN